MAGHDFNVYVNDDSDVIDDEYGDDDEDRDDLYRKENDVLPLHNIENGEDHSDDEEHGDNDSNCSSGVGLDWRGRDDVPEDV